MAITVECDGCGAAIAFTFDPVQVAINVKGFTASLNGKVYVACCDACRAVVSATLGVRNYIQRGDEIVEERARPN